VKAIESKPSWKLGRGKEETLVITRSLQAGEQPELFPEGEGGGLADPESIYDSCLILKIML
jgi:hypothetical protein